MFLPDSEYSVIYIKIAFIRMIAKGVIKPRLKNTKFNMGSFLEKAERVVNEYKKEKGLTITDK